MYYKRWHTHWITNYRSCKNFTHAHVVWQDIINTLSLNDCSTNAHSEQPERFGRRTRKCKRTYLYDRESRHNDIGTKGTGRTKHTYQKKPPLHRLAPRSPPCRPQLRWVRVHSSTQDPRSTSQLLCQDGKQTKEHHLYRRWNSCLSTNAPFNDREFAWLPVWKKRSCKSQDKASAKLIILSKTRWHIVKFRLTIAWIKRHHRWCVRSTRLAIACGAKASRISMEGTLRI